MSEWYQYDKKMLTFLVFLFNFASFLVLTWSTQLQQVNSDLKLIINPSGHMMGNGPPILIRKVDDPLNLTCRLVNEKHDFLPNYNISWNWQYSQGSNANRVMILSMSHNAANLVFKSLKETDSGEYTCKCSELDLFENVWVKVKGFKRTCSDKMFVCSNGNCIGRNFVCDGKQDCKFGSDEDPEYCGLNPCEGKIPCDNGRCIPTSWCCDEVHDLNCTTKYKPKCCQQLVRYIDSTAYVEHPFGDMGFLQTTIYTVIGCAMAFMFIVTILVIAICRVHLKRTVISRCPLNHQHHPGSPIRTGLPLYDIDMFLDRQQDHTGLLVTYNINNGVQFVGRPVDPPPYCEIIDTPPREGPPPPYVSHENITTPNININNNNNGDEEGEDNNIQNYSLNTEIIDVNKLQCQMVGNTGGGGDEPPSCSSTTSVPNNTQLQSSSNDSTIRINKPSAISIKNKTIAIIETTCNNLNLNNIKGSTVGSSLGELSKFTTDTPVINSYEICSSVPSVSGLNKIKNKNIKKNVLQDFSDSDTDSSYMENDALLLPTQINKSFDTNIDDFKSRSENSSNSSFITNIAAVSKSLIGSLSKKQTPPVTNLEASNSPEFKLKHNKKNFRPLLTQKSFDSSDRTRKELVLGANNFDKIVPNCAHSLGDLSPVSCSELNYEFSEQRRDFLTLPLRESHIGIVRNEDG